MTNQNNKINIREIAKLAGVSVASVSRALQKTPSKKISEKTRQKILAICDQHHYQPNMHTVRMFSKKANMIAFIYPPYNSMHDALDQETMNPYLGASIAGAEDYYSSQSIYLTLASTTEKFVEQKEYQKIIRSKMVDGILIWGWCEKDHYINDLLKENIPIVMLQNEIPGNDLLPRVISDEYNGMCSVVEYVIKSGHKKIAIANPLTVSSTGKARFHAIRDTLKTNGIQPYFTASECGFGPEFGYKAGKEILTKKPDTTCIIAPNDAAALGITQAMKEHGLKVPDDISVTGADGMQVFGQTQLTTFTSPSYQIGKLAAEKLLNIINGTQIKERCTCLPVNFIKGETVKQLTDIQ